MIVDTARITSSGQVTIPQAIRERFGLHEGVRVLFEETPQGELRVIPLPDKNPVDSWRPMHGVGSIQGLNTKDEARIELTKAGKIEYLRELYARNESMGDRESYRWYARKCGLNDKTVKAYLENPEWTDRAKMGHGRRT